MDPSEGGPPMALSRLAAAQATAGAHATIAALHPHSDRQAMESAYGDIPGYERVRFVGLPDRGWAERLLARGAAEALAPLISEHDIVHVHGVWRPHLLQAVRGAQAAARPFVISPHGMLSLWSLEQKALKKRVALRFGWRAALERAAFLHVLNRDEAVAVTQVCRPQRLVVQPNGVNLQEIARKPEWQTVWDRFPALRGKRYVAFVGRLHQSKGLDILAEAFSLVAREVPDAHLVVMGPEFGAGPSFREQIRRLGIADRVSLLGGVFGADKAALLHHAQCFCLPSRQEGFSMAIVEALALGLPAVITESCHFPEVAEARAGMVVPLTGPSVGNALIDLLCDHQQRTRCGAAAQELSHRRYQWRRIASGFLAAYEEALGSQASPSLAA